MTNYTRLKTIKPIKVTTSLLTMNGGCNLADKDDDTDKKSSSDQDSSEVIESVNSNEVWFLSALKQILEPLSIFFKMTIMKSY